MKKREKAQKAITDIDFCAPDSTTRFNHPYVRLIFNLLAILLLGSNFSQLNNAYFTSVILFALPMLLEYLAFNPDTPPRKVIKSFQLALLILIVIACTMGFMGILLIEIENESPHIFVDRDYAIAGGFSFSALWLLFAVWGSFLFNAIDVFAIRSPAEKKINGYAATTSRNGD